MGSAVAALHGRRLFATNSLTPGALAQTGFGLGGGSMAALCGVSVKRDEFADAQAHWRIGFGVRRRLYDGSACAA